MLAKSWRGLILALVATSAWPLVDSASAAGRVRRQTVVSDRVIDSGTASGEVIVSDGDSDSSLEPVPAGDAEPVTEPAPGHPLFSNYYTVPGVPGTPAQLYLSPRPTPPLVGHTYITYPPFMPHEYLYRHHRTIASANPDGSRTMVRMRYGYNPFNQVWRTPRVAQKTKVDPVITGGGSFTWWRVNPAFRD